MRQEYEMSEADLKGLLEACTSAPLIMLQCGMPPSPQERANLAWKALGDRMGFDSMSVKPIPGKSQRCFTAIPTQSSESTRSGG